jgi:hypothetical protein
VRCTACRHPGRYCWLLLAEGHLMRRLLGSMVRRPAALAGRIGWALTSLRHRRVKDGSAAG